MKIALIRREYITHLDGDNRFIALLGEGLRKLGHKIEVFSWCYRGVEGGGWGSGSFRGYGLWNPS